MRTLDWDYDLVKDTTRRLPPRYALLIADVSQRMGRAAFVSHRVANGASAEDGEREANAVVIAGEPNMWLFVPEKWLSEFVQDTKELDKVYSQCGRGQRIVAVVGQDVRFEVV